MAYPILSIAVALALFLFVPLVVVVMFENIFRDFGMPLPRMTVAMHRGLAVRPDRPGRSS